MASTEVTFHYTARPTGKPSIFRTGSGVYFLRRVMSVAWSLWK